MISLQLEQMSGSTGAIQLNHKSVAIFVLWVTQLEISPCPWQFYKQSYAIQHLFLGPWDQTYITNPGPAAIYLDVLLSCINISHDQVTECSGPGQVVKAASICLLHALSGIGPMSVVAEGIRQQYLKAIPPTATFKSLLCHHTMNAIHAVLIGSQNHQSFEWVDYKPCGQEHIFFAVALVQIAHTRKLYGKVPRWILHFAIDSLSQDPPPPTPVILNCLLIVAIDLDCNVSSAETKTLDKRYV